MLVEGEQEEAVEARSRLFQDINILFRNNYLGIFDNYLGIFDYYLFNSTFSKTFLLR